MVNNSPPRLPEPPPAYDPQYMAQLLDALRIFFDQITALQPAAVTRLNIDLRTIPTDADFANLRPGEVYVDTTAGNALKIKS